MEVKNKQRKYKEVADGEWMTLRRFEETGMFELTGENISIYKDIFKVDRGTVKFSTGTALQLVENITAILEDEKPLTKKDK